MFDYCGVYIGVSTKSSYLFYIDFCLAITRLGKQNAGKIFFLFFFSFFFFFIYFFFFIERTTYSSTFETTTIGLFSLYKKRPRVALLKLPL